MNYLISITIAFSFCHAISCKKDIGTSTTETAQLTYDSSAIINIESVVNEINAAVQLQGQPLLLPFPVYNQNDTIKYWLFNENPGRISVNMIFPDKVVWPTFFVKDDKLVLSRMRVWEKDNNSLARETLLYFQDDNIIYCTHREINLQPGEMPLSIRDKPLQPCKLPITGAEEEYKQYWSTISNYLNDHLKK